MPLLLFFSALLTALTGAAVGVRSTDVQISRRAYAAQVEQKAIVVAVRTAGHAHLLGAFAVVRRFASWSASRSFVAAPRLYLDRLRA